MSQEPELQDYVVTAWAGPEFFTEQVRASNMEAALVEGKRRIRQQTDRELSWLVKQQDE